MNLPARRGFQDIQTVNAQEQLARHANDPEVESVNGQVAVDVAEQIGVAAKTAMATHCRDQLRSHAATTLHGAMVEENERLGTSPLAGTKWEAKFEQVQEQLVDDEVYDVTSAVQSGGQRLTGVAVRPIVRGHAPARPRGFFQKLFGG